MNAASRETVREGHWSSGKMPTFDRMFGIVVPLTILSLSWIAAVLSPSWTLWLWVVPLTLIVAGGTLSLTSQRAADPRIATRLFGWSMAFAAFPLFAWMFPVFTGIVFKNDKGMEARNLAEAMMLVPLFWTIFVYFRRAAATRAELIEDPSEATATGFRLRIAMTALPLVAAASMDWMNWRHGLNAIGITLPTMLVAAAFWLATSRRPHAMAVSLLIGFGLIARLLMLLCAIAWFLMPWDDASSEMWPGRWELVGFAVALEVMARCAARVSRRAIRTHAMKSHWSWLAATAALIIGMLSTFLARV